MHLKNSSTVLIAVLIKILGKFCCSVVKLDDNGKTSLNYVTLNVCIMLRYPMAVLFFSKLIPQQVSMLFKSSMHTYKKLQVTNVAVYVNKQLSGSS